MEPIDPAVHVLFAVVIMVDIDANGGCGLARGDHSRVIQQPHLVDVACAGHEGRRVQCAFNTCTPGDGRELGRIEADCEARAFLRVYTLFVYTCVVLDRLLGFEWDMHNAGHIALHGVSPEEVEETARRRHVIIPSAPGGSGAPRRNEKRWKLFGRTAAGRCLVVVFTVRRKRFRTVTAYTMNQAERRVYALEIEG